MVIADGLEQVGFSQPYSSVEEQRIVEFSRFFGNTFGSGIGKLIGIADDETVKSEGRVQVGTFGGEIFRLCMRILRLCSGVRVAHVELHLRPDPLFDLKQMGDFVSILGMDPFGDMDIGDGEKGHIASGTFRIVGAVADIAFVFGRGDLTLQHVEDLFADVH